MDQPTMNVLWLTGLSGSGKSTIANELVALGYFNIDGDVLRSGLCNDLGFDEQSRKENIRRAAHLAKMISSKLPVAVSLISPYNSDRQKAKEIIGNEFKEIYINCSIDICKERDPKGLYEKVNQGLIKNFTGIDAPYEAPTNPDLILNTDELTLTECIEKIIAITNPNCSLNAHN
jgi:adenylylsulfate kinase